MPTGSYAPVQLSTPEITVNTIRFHETPVATAKLMAVSNAPVVGSADYVPYLLALHLLEARLQKNVDQSKNLARNFSLHQSGFRQNYTLLLFESAEPDRAGQAVIDEIRKLKKTGFTADELQSGKDNFLVEFYSANESGQEQTAILARYEIADSWTDAEELMNRIQSVTQAEAIAALRKYMIALRYYYFGKKEMVNPIIFQQPLE
jgi:predicted Zn-dependent peptidase